MKITTIGLGYIGLPTAILFAIKGHDVQGVDVNPHVIRNLNEGKIHLNEKGLQSLFSEARKVDRLKISLTPSESDVFIIAVPTPNLDDAYRSCDLSYVQAALLSVIPYLKEGNLVIVESTISPRTTEDVIQPILEAEGFIIGVTLFLAHCPERILPGNMIEELVNNPRIIGGITPNCTAVAKSMYATVVKGELIEASASEAELSKLMENTYRDVNIALANELSKIGLDLSINALTVIKMANRHPRVNLHSPGPGVGGHCLAVDPYFVVAASPRYTPMIQIARKINSSMPDFIVQNINSLMAQAPTKKIALFGLTYKGNIEDIRESPAQEIYQLLQVAGYEIMAYDPYVASVTITSEEACKDSSLLVILTDHDEFKQIPSSLTNLMRQAHIFDTKEVVQTHDAKLWTLGNLYEQIRDIS